MSTIKNKTTHPDIVPGFLDANSVAYFIFNVSFFWLESFHKSMADSAKLESVFETYRKHPKLSIALSNFSDSEKRLDEITACSSFSSGIFGKTLTPFTCYLVQRLRYDILIEVYKNLRGMYESSYLEKKYFALSLPNPEKAVEEVVKKHNRILKNLDESIGHLEEVWTISEPYTNTERSAV